jgi:type III restriction enzyme
MHPTAATRVTPTTAQLLRHWFSEEAATARGGLHLNEGQRWALLDTITAHEAMGRNERRMERPVHRVSLTLELDQRLVMLGLLVWQVLNRIDAQAARAGDVRFTRHFVVVASEPGPRERLIDALLGRPEPGGKGARDFASTDLVRLSPLLIPPARRREVLAFVRTGACSGSSFAHPLEIHGVIAVTDGRLDTLECLARLPNAMLIDDDTRPAYNGPYEDSLNGPAWRAHVRRFATTRKGHGVQVLFTHPSA